MHCEIGRTKGPRGSVSDCDIAWNSRPSLFPTLSFYIWTDFQIRRTHVHGFVGHKDYGKMLHTFYELTHHFKIYTVSKYVLDYDNGLIIVTEMSSMAWPQCLFGWSVCYSGYPGMIILHINSLAPGKFDLCFWYAIFKRILMIDGWGISSKIVLVWMSLDF